jgi:hypothetical protein
MKRIAIVVLVLASGLVLGNAAPAGATSDWCSDPGSSTPCIVSATLNGSTITSSDPTYDIFVSDPPGTVSHEAFWLISTATGELGADSLDDVWVVQFDMGPIVPRVAFTHGNDVTIVRTPDGGGSYHVTVTATPVVILGECDQSAWPWTCPTTATQDWNGYLDGEISDYEVWSDIAQRNSVYGMNFSSNVAATGLPPEIVNDPTTGAERLLIRLANPHFRMDGSTVFVGFIHQRIPNAFLHEVYAIDSPSTLTTSGLDPIVTGPVAGSGTVSVTEEGGGGAMLVNATGMTFSTRRLLINRGVITPTKPLSVHARRLGPNSGRLRFDPATPRGSRITGYRARCAHNASVVLATGSASPLTVTGLRHGAGYDCRVTALSRAGPGTPSALIHMPARA